MDSDYKGLGSSNGVVPMRDSVLRGRSSDIRVMTGTSNIVFSGGSWNNNDNNLRSAYRTGLSPAIGGDYDGFRVVVLSRFQTFLCY